MMMMTHIFQWPCCRPYDRIRRHYVHYMGNNNSYYSHLPWFWTIHFQMAISSSQWANEQSGRWQRFFLARSQQMANFKLRGMVGGRLASSFLHGSMRNETPIHGCPTLPHWFAFGDLVTTSLKLDLVQHVSQISITRWGQGVDGGLGSVGGAWVAGGGCGAAAEA